MSLKRIVVITALAGLAVAIAGCSKGENEKGQTMNTMTIELTDASFDNLTSEGLVLVDFWAPWCGPCKMQGPIIEKVAVAMQGKAKVGKCDVDKAPKSAERFGITGIPTLIVLQDKREVERFVGLQQEAALISALEKHNK